MTTPIAEIARVAAPVAPSLAPRPGGGSEAGAFQKIFETSIQQVNADQNESVRSVESFLSGETEDLHKAALATQRAELSFEMFMQVRNKMVQAYQEVMRMQI